MDAPSEDEMINRILRFYAGQNMEYKQTFKQTLKSFEFDKYFLYETEEELLKQRMMELNLLKSKKGRLIITNHGRDIVMKHGGWIKYQEREEKKEKFSKVISKSEVWLPILISLIALIVPQFQLAEIKNDVLQKQSIQTKRLDSLLKSKPISEPFIATDSLD